MGPNYQVIIQAMIDSGELSPVPGVRHLIVAYDDWCAIFRGGRCDCQPEITIRPLVLGTTPEAAAG